MSGKLHSDAVLPRLGPSAPEHSKVIESKPVISFRWPSSADRQLAYLSCARKIGSFAILKETSISP
jgi:hypothetical protein